MQLKNHYTEARDALMVPENVDRAGAATNNVTEQLAKKLRETHRGNLDGFDTAYYRWANYILSCDAHKQNELINDLPPSHLIQLFRQGQENPVQRINQLRRSVAIGQRLNRGVEQTIQGLDEDIDSAIEYHEQSLKLLKKIKRRCEGLHEQLTNNDTLLDSFDEAIGPRIDEHGQQLLSQIEDIPDVDHREHD